MTHRSLLGAIMAVLLTPALGPWFLAPGPSLLVAADAKSAPATNEPSVRYLVLAGRGMTIANESPPGDAQLEVGPETTDSERLIRAAFDKHFERSKSEMYGRLTKDKDGNSE